MTTPTTRASRHALKVDAKNRAWRTLLQGLATDVLVASAAALLAWLPDADITSGEAWTVIGLTLAKTALTTAASWVMRAKLDPSRVRTPLPPADPGEPDDDTPPHDDTLRA